VPALVERSPVGTEASVNRARELADEATDTASGLEVELADVVGGDVIADRANVVAVLPVAGDDADVGHAGDVELIDLPVSVGDVSGFPVTESASSYREMDLLGEPEAPREVGFRRCGRDGNLLELDGHDGRGQGRSCREASTDNES
jgi:hypothetical protein